MPAPLVLERFDACAGVLLDGGAPGMVTDTPVMDAAPVRPPRPDDDQAPACDGPPEDPEALLREALAAERATLRAVTAGIRQQAGRLAAAATRQAADAVARAAADVLPALIDAAFAAELAAATTRIVEAGARSDMHLALAPGDHDAVIEALSAHRPPLPVTVMSDSELLAGTARLTWHAGGAEFDARALTARALELVHDRIAAISEGKTDDE